MPCADVRSRFQNRVHAFCGIVRVGLRHAIRVGDAGDNDVLAVSAVGLAFPTLLRVGDELGADLLTHAQRVAPTPRGRLALTMLAGFQIRIRVIAGNPDFVRHAELHLIAVTPCGTLPHGNVPPHADHARRQSARNLILRVLVGNRNDENVQQITAGRRFDGRLQVDGRMPVQTIIIIPQAHVGTGVDYRLHGFGGSCWEHVPAVGCGHRDHG